MKFAWRHLETVALAFVLGFLVRQQLIEGARFWVAVFSLGFVMLLVSTYDHFKRRKIHDDILSQVIPLACSAKELLLSLKALREFLVREDYSPNLSVIAQADIVIQKAESAS